MNTTINTFFRFMRSFIIVSNCNNSKFDDAEKALRIYKYLYAITSLNFNTPYIVARIDVFLNTYDPIVL